MSYLECRDRSKVGNSTCLLGLDMRIRKIGGPTGLARQCDRPGASEGYGVSHGNVPIQSISAKTLLTHDTVGARWASADVAFEESEILLRGFGRIDQIGTGRTVVQRHHLERTAVDLVVVHG